MERIISINSENHNNTSIFSPKKGVPLVCSRVYRPVADDVASRASLEKLAHDQDGVIESKPCPQENRIIRYQRQAAARKLLPDSRVFKCLRWRLANTVKVLKSVEHGKCHYGDLIICGSVWDCPVCAAKIAEIRRLELTLATQQHTAAGGSVLLVTLTYPHQREDDLSDLLARQAKAMIWFYSHRDYKDLKKRYMKKGRVRALEVNHGEANGWHPHVHELWFMDLHLSDFETLHLEVLTLWRKACVKHGLGLPSFEHGVDIRGGDYAAKYVTKFGQEDKKDWSIEHELTKANVKKGRKGSRSPFQLLDDYIEGDKRSGALFAEYSKAFYRKKQLTWSRGLKAQFDLEEKTDDDIAHDQEDVAVLLAEIETDEWYAITKTSTPKQDNRALVLTLAENGGADAMRRFIADLVTRYKQSN